MYNAIRWAALPALLLLIVGTLTADVPGEELKKTEELRRLEAMRLEQVVADAVSRASAVGRTNPQRAIEILREANKELAADTLALKPERREALLRTLKLQTNIWSEKADNRVITPGTGTGTLPRGDQRPPVDTGKTQSDLAKGRIEGVKGSTAELAKVEAERARANVQMALVMAKLGIPEYRDISYPRDWAEKMAKRTTGVKMTEQEKAILRALGATMNADYTATSFKEVIDDLQKRMGVPFVVDPRALDEANVKYGTEITLNLPKVTSRTVLKRLLADLNLTYVVKDQAIQITTPARAKEMLSIRTYAVGDLMPTFDMRIPYNVSQAQSYETLKMLVYMITQNVEPDSWEVNGKGGLGTIQFDPIRFMLIVKQTAEVHYLMGLTGR